MVSFLSRTKTWVVSALLSSASLAAASGNLRSPKSSSSASRERQLTSGWFCDTLPFLCPEEPSNCPVVSPLSAENFDLDQYIAKTWFVQKQQTNPYQSENQLYCIAATYNQIDDGFLDVSNYGNNGQVNGPVQDSDDNGFFSNLCGKQTDGGELSVAPCLFRPIFEAVSGPYWVLDVATDYSWAIVSGGAPDQPRTTDPANPDANLCTTKEGSNFFDTNGSGLWLFTREKVADQDTINTMEAKLTAMGVYTGDLKTVAQANCNYDGATLKE